MKHFAILSREKSKERKPDLQLTPKELIPFIHTYVNNQFLLANLDTTFTKRIAIRQTTNLYFTETERHQKLVHLLVCKMQNDFFCGDNCILHNLKDTFGYQGNIKWHFC